jgi:hypothetical protein
MDKYIWFSFFFGLAFSGTYSVAFAWYLELLPQSHAVISALIPQITCGWVMLGVLMYFKFINKNDDYLFRFESYMGLLMTLIMVAFMDESPKYLLQK